MLCIRLPLYITGALLLFWLAGCSTGNTLPPDASGLVVDLAEYQQRIESAIFALESTAASDMFTTTARLQAELAEIQAVRLPSGDSVSVLPLLGSPHDASEAISPRLHRNQALHHLRVVHFQLQASATDHTAARLAQLDTVLAASDFILADPPWNRFWRWLQAQARRLLQGWWPAQDITRDPSGSALQEGVGWIVLAAGLLLVLILLTYWLQALIRSFVEDAEAKRRQVNGEDPPLTAAAARTQAQSAAASGDYRHAVRNLYLSALLLMEEKGVVHYDRTLTNREVLATVSPDTPVRPHLEQVVGTFDQVWYGVREPDGATFSAYAAEIDALGHAVNATASAGPGRPTTASQVQESSS
jgi:hypothetical protein